MGLITKSESLRVTRSNAHRNPAAGAQSTKGNLLGRGLLLHHCRQAAASRCLCSGSIVTLPSAPISTARWFQAGNAVYSTPETRVNSTCATTNNSRSERASIKSGIAPSLRELIASDCPVTSSGISPTSVPSHLTSVFATVNDTGFIGP